jgi:hypothetical protein
MTIEKVDGVWAETGDRDETITAAKKTAGFVGGDQPEIEIWNQLIGRGDDMRNRIVEERLNSYYDGATDHKNMLTTGLWDDSWGTILGGANYVNAGKGFLCVFYNADSNPRLLVTDGGAGNEIYLKTIDPRSLSVESTSHDISADLSTPTGVWTAQSICTDGTHAYVVFTDGGNNWRIHSWKISDWTENSGWTATGTALPGTGTKITSDTKNTKAIIASSTKLAVSNVHNVISASTSAAISIVDISDGTITSSGAGDAPTGISAQATGGLCSDGTNVFFSVYDGTNTAYLCSATIANPQAGCGGTNFPFQDSSTVIAHWELCSCGPQLIAAVARYTAIPSNTDTAIRVFDDSDADLDYVVFGQVTRTPTQSVDEWIYDGDSYPSCTFDGLNLWINALTTDASSDRQSVLLKIDVAKFSLLDRNDEKHLEQVLSGGPFIVRPDLDVSSDSDRTDIAFDGRDIWVYLNSDSDLRRLPLALLRN